MENTIKILLLIFTLISGVSCTNNKLSEAFYEYTSLESDNIISFDSSNLRRIKDNLYLSDDTLYIGTGLFEDVLDDQSNSVDSRKKGVLLFNTARYNINIDTSSYTFLIPNLIAFDKNMVIAFPKGNHKLPYLDVLKLNPKNLKQVDDANTYLKDSNFVYCVPSNTYIDVDPKNFEIEMHQDVIFGKSGDSYYYLDEHINLDDFFSK